MLKYLAIAAALVLGASPVQASPKWIKTLPREFYIELAQHGKSETGLVWTAPGFDPSRGITWDGSATWSAKERSKDFLSALQVGIKAITKPTGPYHLLLNVVQAEPDFLMRGDFRAEFQILDESGKVVALASEFSFTQVDGLPGLRSAADNLVSALEIDLFK